MYILSKIFCRNTGIYVFKKRLKFINYSQIFYSNLAKLYEKSFQVNPGFGTINLKSNCNCTIQPADPQYFPDADHVEVILWSEKPQSLEPKINLEILGKKDFVRIEIETLDTSSVCQLVIPIKYDIEAALENEASLEFKNLESDNIHISSLKGSIKANNIKTKECTFSMQEGSLSLDGAFQGNLNINAKKLSFRAKRLQGTNLCIQASDLDTDIDSSYMTNGNIFAERGNLNIKNLHGSTSLHLFKGNLFVNGLHGKLQTIVNEGKLDIQVSQLIDNTLIQLGKGSLDLSFMDLSRKNVEVNAPELLVHSDVESFGSSFVADGIQKFVTTFKDNPTLHANVKTGSVTLMIKDWFSSLGINKK